MPVTGTSIDQQLWNMVLYKYKNNDTDLTDEQRKEIDEELKEVTGIERKGENDNESTQKIHKITSESVKLLTLEGDTIDEKFFDLVRHYYQENMR